MYISCGPPGRFWVICGNMSSQKLWRWALQE
jgi:hypothetical protein